MMTLLSGCTGNGVKDGNSGTQTMDLSTLELDEYISLGQYTGLEIAVHGDTSYRGEAVWQAVVNSSVIKKYPEQQLEYYAAQSRDKYRYAAEQANMDYEEFLVSLEIDEEHILSEARTLCREDLVWHALLRAENISLSDEEKAKHFDRYVDKYVSDYGYSEQYVRENLEDDIYSSMLYDKTLEFLISKNKFNVMN